MRKVKHLILSDPISFTLPIIGFAFVLFLIGSNYSINLSMSGMPVSDANGWSSCMRALSIFGEWPENVKSWCYRRPLFPITAQFLYYISGSIHAYLILVNLLFFLTQYFFLKTLKNFSNKLGILLIWFFSTWYWINFASTQIMSEQLGLILGLAGTLFLWKYLFDKTNIHFGILSISFLFLAQAVRPGNLLVFLLPMFLILFDCRKSFRNVLLKISLPLISIFLIIFGYSRVVAGKDFMSSGNSWSTIYGLTKDNSSWDVAYKDIDSTGLSESEFWGEVRRNAIQQIRDNPETFLNNIFSNGYDFYSLYFFRIMELTHPAQDGKIIINLLIGFIIIFSVIRLIRIPHQRVDVRFLIGFAFLFISEFFFYGISLLSDPVRAMSSSAILFISMLFIIVLPTKDKKAIKHKQSTKGKLPNSDKGTNLQILSRNYLSALTPVWTLILLLILTPIGSSPDYGVRKLCPDNSVAVSREGLTMRKKSDITNIVKNYWWFEVVNAVPEGFYLQGFSINKQQAPVSRSFFIPGDQSVPNIGVICIAPSDFYQEDLQKISFIPGTIVSRDVNSSKN
jgi:hypothetical protein